MPPEDVKNTQNPIFIKLGHKDCTKTDHQLELFMSWSDLTTDIRGKSCKTDNNAIFKKCSLKLQQLSC